MWSDAHRTRANEGGRGVKNCTSILTPAIFKRLLLLDSRDEVTVQRLLGPVCHKTADLFWASMCLYPSKHFGGAFLSGCLSFILIPGQIKWDQDERKREASSSEGRSCPVTPADGTERNRPKVTRTGLQMLHNADLYLSNTHVHTPPRAHSNVWHEAFRWLDPGRQLDQGFELKSIRVTKPKRIFYMSVLKWNSDEFFHPPLLVRVSDMRGEMNKQMCILSGSTQSFVMLLTFHFKSLIVLQSAH